MLSVFAEKTEVTNGIMNTININITTNHIMHGKPHERVGFSTVQNTADAVGVSGKRWSRYYTMIVEVLVMYTFDLEAQELVRSQCFPGNMLDLTTHKSVQEHNHITKGLIVSGKYIHTSAEKKYFGNNSDLRFLSTLLTIRLINSFDKAGSGQRNPIYYSPTLWENFNQ